MVRAVLNIIKLNPDVKNSPDIPIQGSDQIEDTKIQKSGPSTPGTAAADEARNET